MYGRRLFAVRASALAILPRSLCVIPIDFAVVVSIEPFEPCRVSFELISLDSAVVV